MNQGFSTVAVLAIAAGLASADSVNMSYTGTSGNLGGSVGVQLSGGLFFQDGSSSKSLWAGQLSHSIDGVATKTYCTELTQWTGSGIFDVVDVADAPSSGPMGQAKAEAIYRLFNATNGAEDIDTSGKAKAFQAVIWEIVYDFDGSESDISMAGGKVQMSNVSSTLFNTYRGFATDLQGDDSPYVIAYVNEEYQDQLGLQVVPLPGAAAMAGLGLAGLTTRRRRS